MESKKCHRCGVEKPLDQYWKQATTKDGRRGTCIDCMKVMEAAYRLKDGAKRAAQSRAWREANPDKQKEADRRWAAANPGRRAELLREWHRRNPQKQKEYYEKRYTDPAYRISAAMRAGIAKSINRGSKSMPKSKILGYTIPELMSHLERQFVSGMSWDNYGEWHIDHVRPVSSFSFSTPGDPEFIECWSLSNLQPLWAQDNLKKGAKLLPANDNRKEADLAA